MINFSIKRLMTARVAKGYTCTSLAKKMGVGVNTISQIELGKRRILIDHFISFCEILDVSPNFLMGLGSYSELDDKEPPIVHEPFLNQAQMNAINMITPIG